MSRFRALVVDDDDTIRRLIATVLERNGFEVDLAVDGQVAMEKIAEAEYSVIFLDLMMPRLSGFEVIKQLRATNAEALRHVVITSAVSSVVLSQLAENSVHRVFQKPFDIHEIISSALECAKKP